MHGDKSPNGPSKFPLPEYLSEVIDINFSKTAIKATSYDCGLAFPNNLANALSVSFVIFGDENLILYIVEIQAINFISHHHHHIFVSLLGFLFYILAFSRTVYKWV